MKRKILLLVTCIVLLIGNISVCSAASKQNLQYDISSVEELTNEIEKVSEGTNELTKVETKNIIDQTDPTVIKQYCEDQIDSVGEALEGVNFTLDESKERETFITKTDDGNDIKITLEDRPEGKTATASSGSSSKTGTSNTAFKPIGDRYFTGSCYYQNGFVTVRIKLENHYTVKKNQTLARRYTTLKECQGFVYCDNSIINRTWTSETASQVGKFINCQLEIHSKVGPLPKVGGYINKYYTANSRVKLLKKTTQNGKKGVNVQQSLKWAF